MVLGYSWRRWLLLGFRVQGLWGLGTGFRVEGLRFRVGGLGLRV